MCSNGMYAVITQDELLPHLEYLETNRPSPIMTVYSYACWGADIFSFVEYFMDTFPESPARISDQTFWIRRSTGRLCVELIKTDGVVGLYPAESGPSFPRAPPLSWNGVDFDVEAANMLSVEDYHRICCTDLSKRVFLGNFPGIEVTLGALIHCPRRMQLEDSVQVARTPTLEDLWFAPQWSCDATQRIRSDGWARFASSEIYQTTIFLDIYTYQFWFSQANHVFNLLNVTSAHNQYVFVANASFELQISAPSTENPVQGYLFLCPPESLRTGATSFCWPACPWFWSVDPAGIHPLSNDDALSMGFPAVELATTIWGRCWDTSVYDGLRQFHAAKGFDPESQELAQHMEFPLFEV
ncbi:hypothetical protein FB45DRAFT_929886 [Roridomyces roridus]|uniref:Uncharacterized protein n=1 Tax=Roridomyces roridus TaxID=1738132 RepID=A0AAD7FF24_9AGAR|nr:hypothetical protein FB45DRAFT_929886 [Roridomyces roridus]